MLGEQEATAFARIIESARRLEATSRPEVQDATGFSRTLVTKYVDSLIDLNILEEGALGPSKGGRAPRQLRFNASAGVILLAELGATGMSLSISDLSGKFFEVIELESDIGLGPEKVLLRIEKEFDRLISKTKKPVWGIGIGLPGPVEFATGIPISPPIMSGWDRYPVRQRLSRKFNAPVWIDNDVNLMALGEAARNHQRKYNELI